MPLERDGDVMPQYIPGTLWKFNVRARHLPLCVRYSMFADQVQHSLQRGSVLVLQLTKSPLADPHRRVTHIICFDRYERDVDSLSEKIWGTRYEYLLRGTVHPVKRPFSLEDLGLSRSYSRQGMISHERIDLVDEVRVALAIGLNTADQTPPAPSNLSGRVASSIGILR